MAQLQFADAAQLSHAYILCAGAREDAVRAARELAAAAVCSSKGRVPCGNCRDCRKAFANVHPDISYVRRPVDDKGKAKKEIVVDQVRALLADSVVLPNESERKVYIIEDADLMNVQAQNAALKLLEEPPKGVIFILCAENAQLLLPTVRSRCAEMMIKGEQRRGDNESVKLAKAYFKAVASGSAEKLVRFSFEAEDADPTSARAFIDSAIALNADMLCAREDPLTLTREQLVRIYELLRRCEAYLKVNTGVKHIFGLLAVASPIAGQPDRKDK